MTASSSTDVYVDAIQAGLLFADPAYQRDLDARRVGRMVAEFDRRLLGVLEVSARADGRYAVLDGQHRHAVVLEVTGPGTAMVCHVYTGLSPEAEAQLFHELNAKRKPLTFWDRWKSRHASGDGQVLAIEELLALHGLQVHPAAADGNIGATAALEVIVDEVGDLELLNAVVIVLMSAFGRTRSAFDGALMQGMAYVLANYDPDELDRNRLVGALRNLPVQQVLARAAAMRELHRGTRPRLVAGFIVEQYNRTPGRKAESFFTRVPERAPANRAASAERARRRRAQTGGESETQAPGGGLGLAATHTDAAGSEATAATVGGFAADERLHVRAHAAPPRRRGLRRLGPRCLPARGVRVHRVPSGRW